MSTTTAAPVGFDHLAVIGDLGPGAQVVNSWGEKIPTARDLTDHELRWALREGISVMYARLGLQLPTATTKKIA